MDDYVRVERRRGYRNLTDPERDLAVRLVARAERPRAEAAREDAEGLGVAEAVALAAVQLGLQPPTGCASD